MLSYRFLAPLFSISDRTVLRAKAEAAYSAAIFKVNRGADANTIRIELERTYPGIRVIETRVGCARDASDGRMGARTSGS